MNKKIIILVLSMLIILTGVVRADFETDQNMYHTLFSQKEENIANIFTETFLDQVPASNLVQILNQYKSQLGNLKEVESTSDGYTLIFEKGEAPSQINVTQDNKIAGLWFGGMSLYEDDFDEILNEFKNLDSEIAISIIEDNEKEIISYNSDQPMAVGSTFKLYILKALYDQIDNSQKSWEDIIKLSAENITLPSGTLQDWPIGSPITVNTMANMMISVSDNTATDHLIDYIGRVNIEEIVTEKNIPFLKTSEMFKLKAGVKEEVQNTYIQSSIKEKRKILNEINDVEVNVKDLSSEPVLIDQIEWFFTTKELCNLIYELKGAEQITINPGLAAKDKWHKIGFKGGSEPGVLQYTHLLQETPEGPIYTVSVTANGKEGVDNNKVTELTSRLISKLRKN